MDTNKLNESDKIIKRAISEGIITKSIEGTDHFFLDKAKQSIIVSNRLFDISETEKINTYLWVINSAYYSMFFAATALLAKYNHKIKSEYGIHRFTYHAIIYYFINQNKLLKKHFIEEYKQAINEAEELMQISENRVFEMIDDFSAEMNKRKIFTYELGKNAEKEKAKTSLKRAKAFVKVIEDII